jgi:amino acid permease
MTIHDMEFGRRNVGIIGTCFNIFKCFIGIGILALPHAFSYIGVIGGCIAILIIGTLNYYTMMMQIECKLKYGTACENYSDLAFLTFGKYGKMMVDFSLFSS